MSERDEELVREFVFGDFQMSLDIFRKVCGGVRKARAKAGEFSYKSARKFAEGLILDRDVEAVRTRVESDRNGATSFYEIAHDVGDQANAQRCGLMNRNVKFVQQSDGKHEPFLLVASAVLNQLDWMEENHPDEIY